MQAEQLSRNALFFGPDGMQKLTTAKIAVVGLGGVGSHAAHMLARAGITDLLRLIDFDQVTLSSLNRHAVATLDDVGIPKVEAMRRFFQRVCPKCNVDARVAMYTQEQEVELLGDQKFDFIVDAIDDIATKASLLAYCIKTNTRVISCMGAGGKSDVTRLHIGDLRSASRDPLAAKLRWFLKKMKVDIDCNMFAELVDIVYSSEKTVVPLAELTDEQKAGTPGEFGTVDNMRVRVLPVLGTMPATMGQAQAAYVLCELGGKPFSPIAGERTGKNVRHKRLQHFKNREAAIRNEHEHEDNNASSNEPYEGRIIRSKNKNKNNDGGDADIWVGPAQIDSDDVEYLLGELWRNRCAVTGAKLGTILELVRWDLSKPSVCSNLVLMSTKAISAFDEKGRGGLSEEIRRKIESRLASCKVDW